MPAGDTNIFEEDMKKLSNCFLNKCTSDIFEALP